MLQNHLLQAFMFLAMEPPEAMTAAAILAAKVELLRTVRTFPSKKRAAIRADIVLTMRENAALVAPAALAHAWEVGVRGLEWTLWPSGTVTDGTLTSIGSMQRLYARELSSNVWASTSVTGGSTSEASIEVTPSLVTVAPNGVVQFTANITNGSGAEWSTPLGSGSINFSTGTYTAPATPGVYVVICDPSGGNSTRYGLATVIVQ
jgi:hypothetical protein